MFFGLQNTPIIKLIFLNYNCLAVFLGFAIIAVL